jgi:hypothetical protein
MRSAVTSAYLQRERTQELRALEKYIPNYAMSCVEDGGCRLLRNVSGDTVQHGLRHELSIYILLRLLQI